MKKSFFYLLLPVAILLLSLTTTRSYAQTSRQISISIPGIEYDDPNLVALREALKKNRKVKLVKPTYASGTAKISCSYTSEAAALWDEIPKNIKQFFKPGSIDENTISLEYTKKKAETAVVTDKPKKGDCFTCEYYPLCKFDVPKTYNGRVFHGIRNDDNSVVYYYCENGELIKRWEYTSTVTREQVVSGIWDDFRISYDDYVSGVASLTILKSNVPVGGIWQSKTSEDANPFYFTMAGKGITLTVDGKTYKDVIKVYSYSRGYEASYDFYAKNVGYIGRNLVDEQQLHANENWVGAWKQVEDNGRKITPEEMTEYIKIEKNGRLSSSKYQKKSTGKLYPVRDQSPFSLNLRSWYVAEQVGPVYYLLFDSEPGVTMPMDKKSIPQQSMIIGTKKYVYLGKEYDFREYK